MGAIFGNFWGSGEKNIDGGHIRDPYNIILCQKKIKKKWPNLAIFEGFSLAIFSKNVFFIFLFFAYYENIGVPDMSPIDIFYTWPPKVAQNGPQSWKFWSKNQLPSAQIKKVRPHCLLKLFERSNLSNKIFLIRAIFTPQNGQKWVFLAKNQPPSAPLTPPDPRNVFFDTPCMCADGIRSKNPQPRPLNQTD